MDNQVIRLHYPNISDGEVRDMTTAVPTYRLYGEATPEPADFWLHCETIPVRTHPNNWEIALHRHDAFFQLFHLHSGHGEMLRLDESLHFSAPAALFIPAGDVHGFRFSRDIDGLVVTALADRLTLLTGADRRIAAFAQAPRVVPLPEDDVRARSVSSSILQLAAELSGRAAGRMLLLEALMTETIVRLVRAGGTPAETNEPGLPRGARRIDELLDLIAAHFREHRPVGFYAERIGVSPTHLNRMARRATGNSVQELIAARILETARRELVFGRLPVQAVAYGLGFSDPAYFNRYFRRATGMTPGAFRTIEARRLSS